MSLNESMVEEAALTWFAELGYTVGQGPKLAPGEPGPAVQYIRRNMFITSFFGFVLIVESILSTVTALLAHSLRST